MTAWEIARLFEELELELVASLKRNLSRHKAQEEAEGGEGDTPERWEAWQAAKLRDIRRFRRENQDILGKYSPQIDEETENMLRQQYEEGGSGGFFHSADERLRSLVEEMHGSESRVEKAALRYADDVYRKTILRTAVAMTAGGMTLQQATDAATKDFLEKGINCVEYANGRRVNIASYAEMALRACATRAMLLGEAKQREALGINTVLVSQYGACSDTCLPWQGLVYIDDVFQTYTGPKGGSFGVSTKGGQFLFLSIAIKAGLFHPNCRHTVTTWIEGVSKKPKPMDAAKIEKVNKLEAEQRGMELEIRKAKRQAAGLTDPAAVKEAERKIRELQSDLRKFIKEHGDVLRRDPWRERDDGVRLDKPKQEEPAAEPTKAKADTEAKPYKAVENAPTEKPAMEKPAAEPPKKKGSTDINLHKEAEHVEEQPAPEPAVRPAKVTASITGEDVSAEYAEQATPGEGTIMQDEGYDASRHAEETKIAEWIRSKFGGDIRLLNESTTHGEKRADFLWRDKLWDLKTASTEKSANTAIKRGLQQILPNPGGIILDYKDIKISMEILERVIDKRMEWLSEGAIVDIMIVQSGEATKVLRYKK